MLHSIPLRDSFVDASPSSPLLSLSSTQTALTQTQEPDQSLYRPALESLRTLIRTSTSSLTSVPKPLKYLRPHYSSLASIQASWPSTPSTSLLETVTSAVGLGGKEPEISEKSLFADILSVLAMTYSDSGKRETLGYRLKGGSEEDPGLWGHEYVRYVFLHPL